MRFNYEVAAKDQEKMSELIAEEGTGKEYVRILGLDASYYGGFTFSAAVIYNTLKSEIERASSAIVKTRIPYVPGFLGFREMPAFMAALSRMEIDSVDLVLIDGHGRFHPRLAGSASHLYLALKKPTVGVAKRPLKADYFDEKGNIWLKGRVVGKILSEPEGSRKLYVSVGGGISLEEAFRVVSKLRKDPGLPPPLNYADKISKMVMKRVVSGR